MAESPQQTAVREAMVPNDGVTVRPRTLGAYARDGLLTARGARGSLALRIVREVPPLGGAVLPSLVGGAMLHLLALAPHERRTWFDAPARLDAWMVSPEVARWFAWLPAMVVAALLIVLLRGALDALMYGRVRDAASGSRRRSGEVLGSTLIAFSGLALVRVAFISGTLMFLAPVLRAVARVALDGPSDVNAVAFTSIAVALLIGLLGYFRFVTTVCASFVAWRPRFFAATLVAGLVAPVRAPRLYAGLYALWITAFVALHGVAAVFVERLFAAHAADVDAGAAIAGLGVVALLAGGASAWMDGVVAVIVGHQLGDLDAAEVVDVAGATQQPLDPPPRGVFVGAAAELSGTVSFTEALGYAPSLDPLDEWQPTSASLSTLRPLLIAQSTGGATEWVVGAVAPVVAVAPEPTVAPTKKTEAPSVAGFAALSGALGRANLRTAGGALEVHLADDQR